MIKERIRGVRGSEGAWVILSYHCLLCLWWWSHLQANGRDNSNYNSRLFGSRDLLVTWLKAGLELMRSNQTGSAVQTNDDACQNVRTEKIIFLRFAIRLYDTSSCTVSIPNQPLLVICCYCYYYAWTHLKCFHPFFHFFFSWSGHSPVPGGREGEHVRCIYCKTVNTFFCSMHSLCVLQTGRKKIFSRL